MDVIDAQDLKKIFDKKYFVLNPSSANNKSFCSGCSVPLLMNHGVWAVSAGKKKIDARNRPLRI